MTSGVTHVEYNRKTPGNPYPFLPPSVYECVCEWVNVMHNLCKAPWIKVLYKCTIYHLPFTKYSTVP